MAKKIFEYAVIYNGIYYPANTPIEVSEESKEKKPTKSKKAVKSDDDKSAN